MKHLRRHPWLALLAGVSALACGSEPFRGPPIAPDGGASQVSPPPGGELGEAGGGTGAASAQGGASGKPGPGGGSCQETRVEGEFSGPSWLPRRPLWIDGEGLHLAHIERGRGLVIRTYSQETGAEQALRAESVFPSDIQPVFWGLDAVSGSPSGRLAVAFAHSRNGVLTDSVLLIDGARTSIWSPPWMGSFRVTGLGWDGEAFTAGLLSSSLDFATARFSELGELVTDVQTLGRAQVQFGEHDTAIDAESGSTVFVGATLPGVSVVGRRGRDTSLTAPMDAWALTGGDDAFTGFTPSVALDGMTALVAWADVDHGIFASELSLVTGEASDPIRIETDPGSVVKGVAVARVIDHWLVIGQDYGGLLVAEIHQGELRQRRFLNHPPAECTRSNSCGLSSDWRWVASSLSVATDGESVWVGVVDQSSQRVEGDRTLFSYRILSLNEGCTYRTLAGE